MSIIALTEKAKEKSRDNIEYFKRDLSPNLRHYSVIYYVRRDTLYRATIFEILTHQRLTWMQLTLCTLSLVCSMCSFLYATFDHHLLRQPPTVTNQPLNIYIYICRPFETKKKKKTMKQTSYKNTLRFEFESPPLDCSTDQLKKKNHEKYTSPPLSISSLRPHWRCSHIVGYFCPFTYVHAHHR